MKKIFSALVIMFAFAAFLCLFGCSKGSSSASGAAGGGEAAEAETHKYYEVMSPFAKSIDLSGLESTISFNGLDLSGTDRILVQLAYCADEYSYWIEDGDTIGKVSDMVKEIKGEDLFYPQGIFGLKVCVTFYRGDSELFYIGIGENDFECGTKIEDNIEGATGYLDAYCYSEGNPQELINLLVKPEWRNGQ